MRALRDTYTDLNRKEKKTKSPEKIGSVGVTGDGRKGGVRKGGEQRKMCNIKNNRKEKKNSNTHTNKPF